MNQRARRPHPLSKANLTLAWDIHTAIGVFLAPALLILFATAIFVPFRQSIEIWSDPFLRVGASGPGLEHAYEPALSHDVEHVEFHVYPEAGGLLEVSAVEPGHVETAYWVDANNGAFVPSRNHVARDLYYLHFFYHLPYGIYLSGLVGLFLSLGLWSGLLVHLRDLIPRFGRIRKAPVRAHRADAHTFLGTVLMVPALLLAISGSMLGLAQVVGAAHVFTTFDGDQNALMKEMGYDWPEAHGTPDVSKLPPLGEVIARADAAIPGLKPHWLSITHPGADDAFAMVYGHLPGVPSLGAQVDLSLVDDSVLRLTPPETGAPATEINRWGVAIHFGDWGGVLVQFLYSAIAIALVGLSLYGLGIYAARREDDRLTRRIWAAAAVTTVGMFFALSVELAASQVLPWGAAWRAQAQTVILFVSWAGTIPWALRWPVRQAFQRGLWASAAMLLVAWFASLANGPSPVELWALGRTGVVWTGLGVLATAAASGVGGWVLGAKEVSA